MIGQVSRRIVRAIGCGVTVVLLANLPGCGKSGETLWPVEGKVMLGGKPLKVATGRTGTVILRPDASKGNTSKHEPRGPVDAEGRYTVSTSLQQGAPPGWYKVGVVLTEPSDPNNMYSLPKALIPTKYNDPDTSGLSLEVVTHPRSGAYDIDLK